MKSNSGDTKNNTDETKSGGDETKSGGDETKSGGDEMKGSSDETNSSSDETNSSGNETYSISDETNSSGGETNSSGDETKSSDDEMKSSGDGKKRNSDGKKRKAEIPPVSALQFDKKAHSLMKQIHELSTLSGVPACLVIRTPEIEPYSNLPRIYTWPESRDDLGRVVDLYKRRKKIDSRGDQILKQPDSSSTAAEGDKTENPKQDSSKDRLKSVKQAERVKVLSELDMNIEAVDGKIDSAFSRLYPKPRKMVETEIGCSSFATHNVLKEPDKSFEAPTRMMESAQAISNAARDLDLNEPPRMD